ncbi:MAG TPA: hydroxymethylbilane synthase, partial [Candidatus Acidoferrales bacterium]|nr:hydroxymethylbilane synthase [Candidatus Acidoferrales bacterium]
AQADVVVIAPTCTEALRGEIARGRVHHEARPFEDADLHGALLVFAATDDDALNSRISVRARDCGVLVNDASDAARGSFVTPAVHRTGSLTFSVETGGASPAFAARLREELRARYDERYARAAAALRAVRDYTQHIAGADERARLLRDFAARPIDELAALNPQTAQHLVDDLRSGASPQEEAPHTYVCATRASRLALHQTRLVMAKLATLGIASSVLEVSTKGDEVQDRSLEALGTDSIFVKELEMALRERRADYAVHSCKDLPSTLVGDMLLAAIGAREDPRDAFCSQRYPSLDALPAGALVGTSSPRRRAQLQAQRPDLRYAPIRGNVDTRLRKLADGAYDAIILAMAGLRRLRLAAAFTVPLDVEVMIPAVGQGALGIECRRDDRRLAQLLAAAVADPHAEIAVRAERAFLRHLSAGCQTPVGAHAAYDGERLTMRAVIAAADGSRSVRGERAEAVRDVAEAELVGAQLAAELGAQGGWELLAAAPPSPLRGLLFLLPRTQERPSRVAAALRGAGATVIEAFDSAAAAQQLGDRLPDVLLFPSSGCVAAVATFLANLRARAANPVVAAMGEASAAAASEAGFLPDVVAPEQSVAAFVQSITECVLSVKANL